MSIIHKRRQQQSDLSELTLLLQLPSSLIVHLIQALTRLFVCVSLHRHITLGHLDEKQEQHVMCSTFSLRSQKKRAGKELEQHVKSSCPLNFFFLICCDCVPQNVVVP